MQLPSSIDLSPQQSGKPSPRELDLPLHSAHEDGVGTGAQAAGARGRARVTVITRTRERPLMLRRCMASVLGQTFPDWLHVIVNDGGNPHVVDLLVAEHVAEYAGRVHVVHNAINVGMQNASNLGVHEAAGDFLVIHDDDDSWQPDFLRACVNFLDEQGAASPVQGVITHTTRVLEEINAHGGIDEYAREEYLPCQSIDLFSAASENPFAPIAFVYRRAVHEQVGLFNEQFSVLGDWDFNLRFLQHFEIGIIEERLANYHWRHRSGGSVYANTVTDALDVHFQKSTELRNHYLRLDLQQGRQGLGYLLNLSKTLRGHSALLWELRHRGDQMATEVSKVNARLRRWEWFFTRNRKLRPSAKASLETPRIDRGRGARPLLAGLRPAPTPRTSAEELAALLAGGRCRVLSLDVFDTALLRRVRRPTDAFLFMEAPARQRLRLPELPFASLRIGAEKIARSRQQAAAGHEEVTLEEIHAVFCELAHVDPARHQQDLQDIEFAAERHLLYANPPVLAAVQAARRAGLRVVFASDMYLPRPFILETLRRAGYPIDDATTLFLSAERGASKHVGNLYGQMLDELGCAPGEIVHVGDNFHSDCQQARARGLQAVHWQASVNRDTLPLLEQTPGYDGAAFADGDLLSSVCVGTVRRRLLGPPAAPDAPSAPAIHANGSTNGAAHHAANGANGASAAPDDLWDRLGYEVGGPLYLLFLRWILAQAKEEGLERLYFLGRDGYYLREASEILCARAGLDIRSIYMAASRRLLNLPQVTRLDPAAWGFLLTPNPNLSARHFLSRLGLDPRAFEDEIRRAGWASPDEIITTPGGVFRHESDRQAMRALLLKLEPEILRQAAEERGRLQAYFRQIGFSDDSHKLAMVDVGWQASSARALQNLLNLPDPAARKADGAHAQDTRANGSLPHRLRAFYFGTWHYAKPTLDAGCKLSSFYFHIDKPAARRDLVAESVEVLELFFGAPHPTITGLREGAGGKLEPVYGGCEQDGDERTLARLARMRTRAVDFVRDVAALVPEPSEPVASFLDWPGTGLNYLDGVLERVLRHPTLAEARGIGTLQARDSFGGDSPTRSLAQPPGLWQRLVDPARLRHAYDHSFWKKGFLAQLTPSLAAKLQGR